LVWRNFHRFQTEGYSANRSGGQAYWWDRQGAAELYSYNMKS
jgi:hypothetical protein